MSSRPEAQSAVFGAIVGFIEDAVTGSVIGPAFLGKGLIGFSSVLIFTDIFFRWTPVLGGVVIITITILERLIAALLLIMFKDITINWTYTLSVILLQALINLPFGIIIRPK
jgi:rod shape-determining protein MreD